MDGHESLHGCFAVLISLIRQDVHLLFRGISVSSDKKTFQPREGRNIFGFFFLIW